MITSETIAPTPSSAGALFSAKPRSRGPAAAVPGAQPSAKHNAAQLGVFTTLLNATPDSSPATPALPSALFLNLIRALGNLSGISESTAEASPESAAAPQSQCGIRFGTTAKAISTIAPEQVAGAIIRSMLCATVPAQNIPTDPAVPKELPDASEISEPSSEHPLQEAAPQTIALPPVLESLLTPTPPATSTAPVPNTPADANAAPASQNQQPAPSNTIRTTQLKFAAVSDATLAFALRLTPSESPLPDTPQGSAGPRAAASLPETPAEPLPAIPTASAPPQEIPLKSITPAPAQPQIELQSAPEPAQSSPGQSQDPSGQPS
ncbi:MAG: hypothetical protein ABI995_11565, partial [Acidobacteriota bacterium]